MSSVAVQRATDEAQWRSALAVHEFLDISKAGCADRRHRIMLHHHDLGGRVAAEAFSNRDNIAALVRQHIREDLGREVSFAQWLACVEISALPSPVARRIADGVEGVAKMVLTHLPAERVDSARRVAELLFLPKTYAPDQSDNCLSIFMNSVGPLMIRQILGPPVIEHLNGRSIVTDWGWIAEAVIMACFGRIPDLREIVSCVKSEPILA